MCISAAALAIPLLSSFLLPALNAAATPATAPPSDQSTGQEVLLWQLPERAKKLFYHQPYWGYHTWGGKLPTQGTYVLSPDKTSMAWMAGDPHSETIYLNGAFWGGPYSKTYRTFMGGSYMGGNAYGFEPFAAFSPDGRHLLARVEQAKGAWKAVLDGKDLPGEYERIVDASFAGPDSSMIALTVKSGKHHILLLNGKQIGGEYDQQAWSAFSEKGSYYRISSIGAPNFSKDGRHSAFEAVRQGKPVVVIDGKESGDYEGSRHLALSPDGDHVAFAGFRLGKWFVNSDGTEQKREFAAIESLAYTPDSQHLVICSASDDDFNRRKTKYRYIVGDREDPEFDALQPMVWDSKGNRYYFGITYNYGMGRDIAHATMVRNGQVSGEAEVASVAITYEANSSSLVVADALVNRLMGRTDAPKGLLQGAFGAFDMTVDRDGNVHFYGVRRQGKKCVVTWDAKEGAAVPCRGGVWFSEDGRHLAHLANEGGEVAEWVDARAGAAVSGVKELAQEPVWSAGPQPRVAFVLALQTNNLAVVVDHKVHREWRAKEVTDLLFSPDGKSFAYRVDSQDGKQLVELNGQDGKRYDVVIPASLRFDDHGLLTYLAVDGLSLYRVTQRSN